MDLITIAFFFYIIDIKRKDNIFFRMLTFYGKASLTLFLIEYWFLPLYVGQLNIIPFLFVVFPMIGFLGILTYLWSKYANFVGTPEWLVGYVLGSSKKKK